MSRRLRMVVQLSILQLLLGTYSSAQDDWEIPFNANDLSRSFTSPETDSIDVATAETRELEYVLNLRTEATALLDSIFDTGLMGSGLKFVPSSIVLDGAADARSRGRFQMSGSAGNVILAFKANDGSPLRGVTNFDFVDESPSAEASDFDFRLRHAYGVVTIADNVELYAGQAGSTFEDAKSRPTSIIVDGTPAGAVFRRQPLLRLAIKGDSGFAQSFAIEAPTSSDFVLPLSAGTTGRLQRTPDLAASWLWVDPTDEKNRVQVALLGRAIGFEDVSFREHFVGGWGASLAAQRLITEDNRIQLGVVGGEGLGRYVFGFGGETTRDLTAAGPDENDQLTAIPTIGAHAGCEHYWTDDIVSNVAYGYAFADTTTGMPTAARNTQDAWANVICGLTAKLFLGLEFHYGFLRVGNGQSGDNHRIQLTLAYKK